ESHTRETKAIQFYGKAANEAENERIKNLFLALVEIEKDHLVFSENS
ncbi:MAG: ferritin, partial [Candidatus Omnitrophica bacterium]|nr:ferritin [Candidatus Omnitrophota bacterium]